MVSLSIFFHFREGTRTFKITYKMEDFSAWIRIANSVQWEFDSGPRFMIPTEKLKGSILYRQMNDLWDELVHGFVIFRRSCEVNPITILPSYHSTYRWEKFRCIIRIGVSKNQIMYAFKKLTVCLVFVWIKTLKFWFFKYEVILFILFSSCSLCQ